MMALLVLVPDVAVTRILKRPSSSLGPSLRSGARGLSSHPAVEHTAGAGRRKLEDHFGAGDGLIAVVADLDHGLRGVAGAKIVLRPFALHHDDFQSTGLD